MKTSFYSLKKAPDSKLVKDQEFARDLTMNLTVNPKSADVVFRSDNSKVIVALDTSFIYLNEIGSDSYMFTLTFPANSSSQLTGVKNVLLYGTVISAGYTSFGITLRLVFFFVVLGSTIYFYFWRLRKIRRNEQVLEQRMVLALSIVTVIFNDPFYGLTVTHPNYASNVFSVMFVVTLATYLVVFWVTILDVRSGLRSALTTKTRRWNRWPSLGRRACTWPPCGSAASFTTSSTASRSSRLRR